MQEIGKVAADISLYVFVLTFSLLKTILIPSERGFYQNIISFFVAIPIGVLAGLICVENNLGQYTSIGLAVLFTLIGERLIITIFNNWENVTKLFFSYLEQLVRKK